jgi:hypothetical protein
VGSNPTLTDLFERFLAQIQWITLENDRWIEGEDWRSLTKHGEPRSGVFWLEMTREWPEKSALFQSVDQEDQAPLVLVHVSDFLRYLKQYPHRTYKVRHHLGIDTSSLFVSRNRVPV